MNDEETQLAAQLLRCIQTASHTTERSQQAKDFKIGVSDLGTCSERTRRLIARIPEAEEIDKTEAFIGTALGKEIEAAIVRANPGVVTQAEVGLVLHCDSGDVRITGHPDLVFPWGVGDIKTVDGLNAVRRDGPTQQQLFQRHLYTKAAHECGLLSVPLEKARTFNVWFDRSGVEKDLHLQMDHYSDDVVSAATMWLDEVLYNLKHDQQAMKEPPRTWCEKVCGHFADCRMYDSDVEGLLTDPSIQTYIDIYEDGMRLVKEGDKMKREAKNNLVGISGYTRSHQLRWTHVNASEVPASTRQAHDRISLSRTKNS